MRVLIVKLSSLGDVIHTLPVVQDILQAYPDARIDWVVEKSFAPVLHRCRGLDRVIECEIRRWRKSPWAVETRWAWRAFKAELQRHAYDAVLDLQGLTKSALVSWLAPVASGGHRYALANQTEGSGYERTTRWAADVLIPMPVRSHAVRRGRELSARALGYTQQENIDFGLQAHVGTVPLAINNEADELTLKKPWVALAHGTSRADKEWPVSNWLDLARRLEDSGYGVALIHGSNREFATSQAIAREIPHALLLPRLELDKLTDMLAKCAGLIGVDSGVSHLAVALALPHVQIYNFDTAWRTGPLTSQKQKSVFGSPTPGVDEVWSAWQAVTAQGALS